MIFLIYQLNVENYISFTKQAIVDKFFNKGGRKVNVKRELRFIDCFQFMASSLDKLSRNLKIDQFVNLQKYFSGNQLSLLLRKGVYDYADCMKKLDETSLPPNEAFYSKLSGSCIADEDYQNDQTVLKEFSIESMKEYHNLYNLSDVLLLADVFENFRNICMNHYGLDLAWYINAPGLAWDAALKITQVSLELLNDSGMLLMTESGIRGGMATISHGHDKANNEYMGAEFEPTKNSKFISHLDANNLYGWVM